MTQNTSPNPLAYTGLDPTVNPQSISVSRAPNVNDWQSFYPGDQWRDTSVTPNVWYVLRSVAGNQGSWEAYTGASGSVVTIIADSGSAIPSGGAITVSGGSTGLTTVASGSTVDLTGTLNVDSGGTGQSSFSNTSALIASGITTTGAFQDIASVASGQLLASAGTSTLPIYTANPTVSTINTTASPFYEINGHNFIYATSFSATTSKTYYITSGGNQSGIIFIQIFGGNYQQQIIASIAANNFDSSKGSICILHNYQYSGNSNQPITNLFWVYDNSGSDNPFLAMTLANVPGGGATVTLSLLTPPDPSGSVTQVGNFTPSGPTAMPGYGFKTGVTSSTGGSAFGFGSGTSNFGIDPNTTANNIFIQNSPSPPAGTPTAGGILYVDAGGLKYIGTSGTTTTLANA